MMTWLALPEVILGMTSLGVLFVESCSGLFWKRACGGIAFASLLGVFLILVIPHDLSFPELLSKSLMRHPIGWFLQILIVWSGLCGIILVLDAFKDDPERSSRLVVLLLFSILGMFVLVAARTLLGLYLGLELMTFPIYLAITAGKKGDQALSLEASLKYFLMGGVMSTVFLFGASLIYASGGSLELTRLIEFTLRDGVGGLASIGLLLISVAVFFKLSVFPFQFWAPDAYEGASMPVTAFMATAVKVASFAFFFKTLFAWVHVAPQIWNVLITILSILTMTWGNGVALQQKNLNRLLAYSSIAHVGYMLIAVSLLRSDVGGAWSWSVINVLLYLGIYVIMTWGVFAVFSACRVKTLEEIKGLAKRAPYAAAALALFMLSLVGIPPTAGFLGKFYVFMGAVGEGKIFLAIVGALNSALAAFYYLKVIRAVYLEEGQTQNPIQVAWAPSLVIALSALCVLLMGLYPASRDLLIQLLT